MDNSELEKLLGPEVIGKLEQFGNTINRGHSDDALMQRGINNVIAAATLIRAYHMALMVAGFTNEQASQHSQIYASVIWRKTMGVS